MTGEEYARFVRRWHNIWDTGDLGIADEILTPDFVDDNHRDVPRGPTGVKQWAANERATASNIRTTIEDVIVEGDKVAARWTGRATQTGAWLSIPPSGKQVTDSGIEIFRVSGGRLAEHWERIDWLGVLQQLGATITPPG